MQTQIKNQLRRRPVQIVLGLIALALVYNFAWSGKETTVPKIKVTRGSITQEVSITGKTQPIDEVDLSFERSGRVQNTYAKVGDKVKAGQVLAELEQSELGAQLIEARASVDAQRAKLEELKKGTRIEDIRITETELAKAKQELSDTYVGVPNTLNDAIVKADDAVRKQVGDLFTNDEEFNVQVSFATTNAAKKNKVENERLAISKTLNSWSGSISSLSPNASGAELDQALADAQARLAEVRDFLNDLMDLTLYTASISESTLSTYKASITTARTNVNTALSTVNAETQSISSQKLAIQRIQDQLNLKLAGATTEQIQAQEAAVRQTEAKVALIQAQISKTVLRSPLTGTVTKQDAKKGEIVGANQSLISVISESNLEIEANIPEVDIGRVTIGNPVHITLDAFPSEKFSGKVVYVDPGETIVDGVVNFKVTIAIESTDPRLKSGLTANLSIETVKKDGVLLLPQYAIVEKDLGTFVRKENAKGSTDEIPVTLGLRGRDGTVEILSGVSENEEVLNIGIKIEE